MAHIPRPELLGIVQEDLAFLREEWDSAITDASLRRSSVVLRRLIVDGELQRAWKAAGFSRSPLIHCSSIDHYLTLVSPRTVAFAAAGGAEYGGMQLRGSIMLNYTMSQDQIIEMQQVGLPEDILPLPNFAESHSMIVEGTLVRRREVVKYVSNKRGGAHFDAKRSDSSEERVYEKLDRVSAGLMLADKDAVFFELLSIGQAIARSDDIARLCMAI